MSIKIRKWSNQFLFLTGLSAIALASTGCGKQEFVVTASEEQQQAPGFFIIPPKVDILLAVDNTGSMSGYYDSMKAQLPKLIQSLDGKNWDYHLTAIPLASDSAAPYVTASRHDGNYGSQWTAPFPGAQIDAEGTLNPSYFKPLSEFLDLDLISSPDNSLNGGEPAFKTIYSALNTHLPQTGFLRDDALLVVLAMSSGEDTSDVILCKNSDGYMTTFEKRRTAVTACYMNGESVAIPTVGTEQSSLAAYKTRFLSFKNSPAQIKFFSAINTGLSQSSAWYPARHRAMAAALGGSSFEISNPGQVLTSLASSLQTQRLIMRTRFLFISQDPEINTLVVTKYINGDPSNAVTIPQSATNGWTYVGWQDNVFAIDSPINMNQASGYTIELHGAAKLQGNDTANITFKPAGAHDTVQ